MSDYVGNHKVRFSLVAAQIMSSLYDNVGPGYVKQVSEMIRLSSSMAQ